MRSVGIFVALLGSIGWAPLSAKGDFQQWLTTSVRYDPSDRIAVQNETTARLSNDRDGLYELENATMLGYKFSKNVAAWAGYVHNPQYEAGDFMVMERRAREQLTIDNFASIGNVSVSGRVRFEQRWRDGIDGTAWRLRPYAKLAMPLGDKAAPTLALTAETFINLNTTSFQASDGFERTRTVAALTFPVGKTVRIEAGYLNQHRFIRGGPDTDEHALTASLALAF